MMSAKCFGNPDALFENLPTSTPHPDKMKSRRKFSSREAGRDGKEMIRVVGDHNDDDTEEESDIDETVGAERKQETMKKKHQNTICRDDQYLTDSDGDNNDFDIRAYTNNRVYRTVNATEKHSSSAFVEESERIHDRIKELMRKNQSVLVSTLKGHV